MGIWDFINSTTESVKRNAPNLTHVKSACTTTFTYGAAAACKIDNAVRVNGLQKVCQQYMPDEEARAKIGPFAAKFAKNTAIYALQEGYKLVPGGNAVAKIASKTINEMKSENHKDAALIKASKESSDTQVGSNNKPFSDYSLIKASKESRDTQVGSYNKPVPEYSIGNQNPEDVLRIFMMKEFIGTRFLDDLIVPGTTKRSK